MGVAGVPAGGPAGSPSGTPAGNKAGDARTVAGTKIAIGGVAAGNQNNLGTVPVGNRRGDGTVPAHQLKIDSIRLRFYGNLGTGSGAPSHGTFQVIGRPGDQQKQADLIDARGLTLPGDASPVSGASVANRNGDIQIDFSNSGGATLEVQPTGANELVGRQPQTFALAQRGGTLGASRGGATQGGGTIDVEVDVVHG